MSDLLQVLVGLLTLGLPLWFAYLDRRAFPRLRWIGEGESIPLWGRLVVVVGVGLAILVAVSAPISGVQPTH